MLQPGTILNGRYEIRSPVGHGGMGTVYCAQDNRLGREVAIKVLRADLSADRGARERFLREGQIAAQIVHPNVVRTYDAGDDPAGTYLVQEFLTGRTLDQMLPLAPDRAAEILRSIAAALVYIHGRGYVHCDVKPQNILIKDNGTPILLDFGIARAAGADTTTLIATPHYLAPERAQGSAPTAASDLYALGIVLFQTVAGRAPFDAPTLHGIIQQHIQTPVPALPSTSPAARVLDRIIAGLTAKRPEDRYASAAAVEADLAAAAGNALHAQPTVTMSPPRTPVAPTGPAVGRTTAPSRSPKRPHVLEKVEGTWAAAPTWQRRRWIIALVVPVVLLLLLGIGIARARRPTQPAAPAELQPALLTVATPTTEKDVAVPNVVGLQFDAATQVLAQRRLVAQMGGTQQTSQAPGIVLQTTPQAGTLLAPNSSVALQISGGPVDEASPTQDSSQPRDKHNSKPGKGKGKHDD